ncbi:hypothetical protein [Breoghania sp.]|uniref:hypothetical protein n=1 Tax=Breoghania sp. TaxID=2065378 RepID=UPI002AA7208E|nr:hypothetical protein [Breoghania sp.]
MPRPIFDGRISLGNIIAVFAQIITLLGIVATVALAWGQIDGRIAALEKGQAERSEDMTETKGRLRAVEALTQRQDATNGLILQALTEIKGRLQRIEALGGRER